MSLYNSALTLLYQSTLLSPYSERLIHGFSGKPASFGGPDTPTNPRALVLENRRNLLMHLGYPEEEWAIPQQVHGHRVGRTGDLDFCQTDAIMLTQPQRPVMLLYADCVPVILYDPATHSGAVIHAGWRGTSQNIVQEAILAMQNTQGARPEKILAVIGPAISQCCFQVSLEVAEAIAASQQVSLAQLEEEGLLAWDARYPQNPRLDLKGINARQLRALGVTGIEILSECTRCREAELFSYRRGEDGRNSAFLILK